MHVIYLARHGETDWNRQNRWQGHTDVALNDLGRGQAAALAERLRAHDLVRAYASDLGRARETAEIVARILGIPLLGTDARLRERSFGLFEGLTAEECEAQHPEHWRRYRAERTHLPPGAEAQRDVLERMRAAVHDLSRAAEGPALLVSHGSAIRALVAELTRAPCGPLANGAAFRITVGSDQAWPVEAIAA